MKTAVEWLMDKLFDPTFDNGKQIDWFEQAKEIEKQQIKNAWDASDTNMRNQFSSSEYKGITFNEWFKNK